jgi:hypothetical protein
MLKQIEQLTITIVSRPNEIPAFTCPVIKFYTVLHNYRDQPLYLKKHKNKILQITKLAKIHRFGVISFHKTVTFP